MDVRVKVIAGVRKEGVETLADGRLLVSVARPAKQGKANTRVCELLALHFGVSFSDVAIRSGHAQSSKVISVRAKPPL